MAKVKSGHGRLIALFVLFVILAAIPLTVKISQEQQEIRQRAAYVIPTPAPRSSPPCFVPQAVLDKLKRSMNIISQNYGYGDVDQDGSITTKDALLILRYVAKATTLSPLQIEVADVDGAPNLLSYASNVTAVDSLLIQRYIARLPLPDGRYSFPVCPKPTPTPAPLISPWSVTPIPTN
ncbi:MAG: hypothetical protein HYT08_05085 [Candidatus Levybacteria bacterium]|nr:hypothetical protein [Candidatus Levybacteria bacterium]